MVSCNMRWFAAALALCAACSSDPLASSVLSDDHAPATPAAARPGDEAEASGSLSLALTAPEGLEFDTFRYGITGPSFAKAGQIDVSRSSTISALIEGIPAGSGYSITLSGSSAPAGRAVCSGSSTFDVMAGAVTEVPVAVACRIEEQAPPQPPVASVPIPPAAPVALGVLLLALGSAPRRRRASAAQAR